MISATILIKELAPFVLKYKWTMVGSLLASVALGAVEPLVIKSIAPLLDEGFIQKDSETLVKIPLLIVGLFVLKGVLQYLSTISTSYLVHGVVADLRSRLFHKILRLEYSYFSQHRPGWFVSKLSFDLSQISGLLSGVWIVVLRDGIMIFGLLWVMAEASWQLLAAYLLMLPAIGLIVVYFSKKMKAANLTLQEANAQLTSMSMEDLSLVREIKLFNSLDLRIAKFLALNENFFSTSMTALKWQAANLPSISIISSLGLGAILFFGGEFVASESMSPGEFTSFLGSSVLVLDPLRRLLAINTPLQKALASWSSLNEIFKGSSELPASTFRSDSTGTIKTLECVSLSAKGTGENTMLQKFGGLFKKGAVSCIEGPSGSGKSTLLDVLLGFKEMESGRILVNGKPLPRSPSSALHLRSHTAVCSQEIFLINASIRENMCLGRSICSDAAILEKLRDFDALDFIPGNNPLDFVVTDLGNCFSGGQKQRLALARAFLCGRPIVFLDEPTSALDQETAQTVMGAIKLNARNKIVIMVSHDRTMRRYCDFSFSMVPNS